MTTDTDEKEKHRGIVGKIKAKIATMGASALVAYLLIDVVMYSGLLLMARTAFKKSAGMEPWHDIRGFLVVVGGVWATNNATKAFRLSGAAALAPAVDYVCGVLQKKLGINKLVASILILAFFGVTALLFIGVWILSGAS
eukprot:gnl/MRDRNA2_/MRDRNA2_97282_c0_seq1.p1 gnl/MRDRNA2_/MRDRNA2_97282_c0~~gnl/MRDRNA2_/MRDRNA2_97282_c0_seq1.p1  ORF type:complete len:140 (+),score=28.58 gnl/MRDRNA2_/MRDRNA2_97282_c0_seq1:89-508(+)